MILPTSRRRQEKSFYSTPYSNGCLMRLLTQVWPEVTARTAQSLRIATRLPPAAQSLRPEPSPNLSSSLFLSLFVLVQDDVLWSSHIQRGTRGT